jgi:hypothetical protein
MTPGTNHTGLAAPERNRFFYGKLMDQAAFDREQSYFNRKRWLLNRLLYGRGVVCGLLVEPGDEGTVVVRPGVALDGFGREVIVPADTIVDPHQPTDDRGGPSGDPLQTGIVQLCLVYAESQTDPVPVLVTDCDTPGNCANGTVREEFRMLIRVADGDPSPPACGLGDFPLPPDAELQKLLAARVSAACASPSAGSCIPLARIDLATLSIDAVSDRPLVLGAALLEELILCIASRLAAQPESQLGRRTIRIISGDGASRRRGAKLPPLEIELLDSAGKPVSGGTVEFQVRSGGGSVEPAAALTDASGIARTVWTLGRTAGGQEVEAVSAGAPNVAFRATAT